MIEDEEIDNILENAIETARATLPLYQLERVQHRIVQLEVELANARRDLSSAARIADRARSARRDLTGLEKVRGGRLSVHALTLLRMIIDGDE
jgi:alkylation response protein AidB-like acyl-CoA dehydrogenase